MRHGIAGAPTGGQSDKMRALTPEGVVRIERQTYAMKKAGWEIDLLLSSAFVRARQTAAIVARALKIDVGEDQMLSPECTLDDLAEVLERHGSPSRAMAVGHQPAMGRLVYELAGAMPRFDPGTAAVLEVAGLRPGGGTLIGLYAPEEMMRLGR